MKCLHFEVKRSKCKVTARQNALSGGDHLVFML